MANVASVYKFSGVTWTAAPSLSAITHSGGTSNFKYLGYLLQISGLDNSSAIVNACNLFNGYAWSTTGAVGQARQWLSGSTLNNLMYIYGGTNSDASAFYTAPEKFNGTAWASYTTPTATQSDRGIAVTQPVISSVFFMFGRTGTGSYADTTLVMNAAESTSSVTASGITRTEFLTGYMSGKVYKISGSTDASNANVQTTNYSWNLSAWTAETAVPIATRLGGSGMNTLSIQITGGNNSAGAAQVGTYVYNGTSWSTVGGLPIGTQSFASSGSI